MTVIPEFEGQVLRALARLEEAMAALRKEIATLEKRIEALEAVEDTSRLRAISKLEAEVALSKTRSHEWIRLVLAGLLGALLSLAVGIILK